VLSVSVVLSACLGFIWFVAASGALSVMCGGLRSVVYFVFDDRATTE